MKATNKKTIYSGFIFMFLLFSFLGCGEKPYETWQNKGIALYNLGRYEEALEAFNKAIEIKPDYPEAWYKKGNALSYLRRADDALEAYNKAIEIKPYYPEAWYDKVVALFVLGRHDEALEAYNKAKEIKLNKYKAWYDKGNILSQQNRYNKALEAYDKAIKIKLDSPEAWYKKRKTLYELGRHEEALEAYNKARAIETVKYYISSWGNRDELYNYDILSLVMTRKEFKASDWGSSSAANRYGGLLAFDKAEIETVKKWQEPEPYYPLELQKYGIKCYLVNVVVKPPHTYYVSQGYHLNVYVGPSNALWANRVLVCGAPARPRWPSEIDVLRALSKDLALLNLKLIKASENGNINTVKDLLAKGADVNAKDSFGRTALSEADRRGHMEIVALLKKAGAKE